MSNSPRDAERRAAGLRIDPARADVWFEYAQVLDPYGDDPNLPDEYYCVGREWFAANPDEKIRVHFSDLPATTRDQLEEKRQTARGGRRSSHFCKQTRLGFPLAARARRHTEVVGAPPRSEGPIETDQGRSPLQARGVTPSQRHYHPRYSIEDPLQRRRGHPPAESDETARRRVP